MRVACDSELLQRAIRGFVTQLEGTVPSWLALRHRVGLLNLIGGK